MAVEFALEWVCAEARDRKIAGSGGVVKNGENVAQLFDVFGPDALLGALAVEPLESLVLEADNHEHRVSCCVSRYKGPTLA